MPMVYADDANHIGTDPESVDHNRQLLSESVNRHGLATHEIVPAGTEGVSLGISFSGIAGHLASTPERDRRLDRALEALVSGAHISGDGLRKVAGHITWRFLLRRPLLSILCHIYQFIEHAKTAQPL